MSYLESFRQSVVGWVHENARGNPHEMTRHSDFIASRLIVALAPLAIAPVWLALRGAPQPWEVVVFVCAAMPMLSVVILSRTGDFVLAQAFSAAGLIAIAVALACGFGGISAVPLVWLALAPVEAVFALNRRLVAATTIVALVALAGIAFATREGLFPRDGGVGLLASAFLVAPAILHVGLAALGGLRQFEMRARREKVGAARFATLASAMGDLVLRHDRAGHVLYASSESESLFGLPPREFMGRGLFERILVQDRPTFLKTIAEAVDGQETARCALRLRTTSMASARGDFDEPVFVWVEMRARRLADRGADLLERDGACVMAVLRDVSQQKLREEQLDAARLEAERAIAWKDRFIANVSHELRTPLNAIIGFSEILGNEELAPADPARRMEYADIVHASGEHLLSVVNSILDISKIEAGRFDILTEPFDVAALIDGCCDMMSLKARQAGIALVRSCPDAVGELVADKRACKQILINLLSNALKFTPSGGRVQISAALQGHSIALEVSDTGVGIEAMDLRRLGDVFFQAGGAHNRRFEGTGLGLSVVRGLVGLHGGSISIESGQGEGTRVCVLLPRDGAPQTASVGAAAPIETIARIGRGRRENLVHPEPQVKKIA